MKSKIFYLLLILNIFKSMSCERDSVLLIELQQDTSLNDINIIFTNISNDTVTLVSEFDHFFYDFRQISGFRLNFYIDDQPFILNWGEIPKSKYKINNGRIELLPSEEVILKIGLPFGKLTKRPYTQKLSLQIELNYRYFIRSKPKGGTVYFKSKPIELEF